MPHILTVLIGLAAVGLIFLAGWQVGRQDRAKAWQLAWDAGHDTGYDAGYQRGHAIACCLFEDRPRPDVDPDVCCHPYVRDGKCWSCGESGLPRW